MLLVLLILLLDLDLAKNSKDFYSRAGIYCELILSYTYVCAYV